MHEVDVLIRALCAGALGSLWIALALSATAWLAGKFLPQTNAATRHMLWWAVLAIVVLLPLRGLTRSSRVTPIAPAVQVTVPAEDGDASEVAVQPLQPMRQSRKIFPLQIPAGDWTRLLLVVWLVCCFVQTVRIAASFWFLRRVKRRSNPAPDAIRITFQGWVRACGIRRPVRLLVSSQVTSPMATGFFSPAIVLPEELLPKFRDRELDHVLLHELAHVARRDDWSNLVARFVAAMVGLHPVAAWVLRQVARERELACDDWVVSKTGEPRPYAASLARLFELCGKGRRMALAAGMAESRSHLGSRIETLLSRGRRFTSHVSKLRMAAVVLAMLPLLAIGLCAPSLVVLAQPPAARRSNSPAIRALPPKSQGSFLAALVAAGYGDLPVDDIIALKSNGISSGYLTGLAGSGWGKLSTRNMIDLHSHGVSPQYLAGTLDAGFENLTTSDVIEMHSRGVRLETFREIHELGFGPYSARQAIALGSNGVSVNLFRALRTAGFTRVDSDEAVAATRHGVGPQTLREASRYGTGLTMPQIIKLKNAGVLP